MDSTFAIDQNTLIIGIAAVVILYILLKIASKVIRLIGVIAVVALGYFFWNGGTVDDLKEEVVQALFKEQDINQLLSTYCEGSKADGFKCECIVKPVYEDLTSRLSAEEIAALANDEQARIAQIRQSMRNQGSTIRSCIVKEKGGEYWDKVKGVIEVAGDQLKKEQ